MNWQLLGYLALVCYLSGMLFKNPRHTMKVTFLGEACNITLYLLTGQMTGAMVMMLNSVRIMAALKLDARNLTYILIACGVGIWILVALTMQHSLDILIGLASMCIGLAQYFRDDYLKYRAAVLGSQGLWIIHSWQMGMTAMLVTCLVNSGLIILSTCWFLWGQRLMQRWRAVPVLAEAA